MAFRFKERAMRVVFILSFALFFFLHPSADSLFAQTRKIDSLLKVIKTQKEDSNKVNTLDKLGARLEDAGKYDSSLVCANTAQLLAEKLNFAEGLADAYGIIGGVYDDQNDFPKALEYYNKRVSILQGTGDKKGIARCLGNMGIIYYEQGNFAKSLEYDNKAMAIAEEIGEKKGVMADLINIGNVYEDEGNYPKVLEYDFKALTIAKDIGDKAGIASSYGCLGNVYYESENADKAIEYWNKALVGMQELGNKYSIARILSNMGNLYSDRGDYTKALEYDYKALKIKEELKDKEGISSTYGNMGILYFKMGDYTQALDYDKKALTLATEIGDKTGIAINQLEMGATYTRQKNYPQAREFINNALVLSMEVHMQLYVRSSYERLATLDSATNNFKQALEDYKKFIVYRDSMQNEANTKKTVQAEMNYEFEQKQTTEKAEQDKKDAIAEQDRNKQKVIRNSFIAGFALMLALAFFIFRGYRQKQKANEIITRQKEEVEQQKTMVEQQKAIVEEKNKDIMDSIMYAKRLQDAILPPLSLVTQYLPESFVLYKPKDIVAGDFYWLEKAGDTILIAAADCTGHGVPGALVSVVCSNALNRTVKEFKITETGKILDKVRELVLETFEKSEDNVQDGMDISLVALTASLPSKGGFKESSSDKNTNLVHSSPLGSGGAVRVQWSGANNSLWYIQNNEMKEVIPNKQPIGKYYNAMPFNTHSLNLKKGDTLYLFTDGYADQFGGEKGKKFKYKQFQEKLLAISYQPLAEQKNILEQTFEEWMGDLEQVDDVLIIGLRV